MTLKSRESFSSCCFQAKYSPEMEQADVIYIWNAFQYMERFSWGCNVILGLKI